MIDGRINPIRAIGTVSLTNNTNFFIIGSNVGGTTIISGITLGLNSKAH